MDRTNLTPRTAVSADARTAFLHQVPFVLLVPENLRPLICQMFGPVRFDFGDEIVRESEPPDALYVLTKGSARVLRNRSGTEVTLRHLKPGTAFGEAALVTDGPRTATVRASEPTEALRLGRDAFDAVVDLHPEVGAALRNHVRVLEISDVLRLDPVFSLIPMALLAETTSEFEAIDLQAGEVLVRAGDPGDAVFVVASGRFVAHQTSDPDGAPIGYMPRRRRDRGAGRHVPTTARRNRHGDDRGSGSPHQRRQLPQPSRRMPQIRGRHQGA